MSIVQQVHFMMLQKQNEQTIKQLIRQGRWSSIEKEEKDEPKDGCLAETICLVGLAAFVIYMTCFRG